MAAKSALRTLSATAAADLDRELMSTGAFSLDQLMELAGLSVSQAVYRVHPPSRGRRILVACGPGNNGGDGLVAARHLWHYSYNPVIYYPKRPKSQELYGRLLQQCADLGVRVMDEAEGEEKVKEEVGKADHVVDAVFGFSFKGAVREPFGAVIAEMVKHQKKVTSVDAPSGWDIMTGPPDEGPAKGFMPAALVSLTAPKPLVRWYDGRHFVGGRFVAPGVRDKYKLGEVAYEGVDQIVEVPVGEIEIDEETEGKL